MFQDPHLAIIRLTGDGEAFYDGVLQRIAEREERPRGILLHFSGFRDGQFIVGTLFSDRDPITRGGDRMFQERVPGARGQPHGTTRGAGHFLQEDKGPELADAIARFIAATS